jgi:hypothetical protein
MVAVRPWTSGRPASEVAICTQLGWYLPPFPKSWDVDCEYNRQGEYAIKVDDDGNRRRTDLIVHRRTGGPGNNLLVANSR